MKIFIRIFFIAGITLSLFIGSCKKQAKCGCDGDIINELVSAEVTLYYDSINISAQFRPTGNPMATYYFCNPSDMMSEMKKYDNGATLLVDAHVYWECNYMMQASNNPYYQSYYQAYMVEVTDIYEDLYGK